MDEFFANLIMKRKILFAITNLTYGGIQTQSLILAKEFQKMGAKIYFFWTVKFDNDFVNNELIKNDFEIIDGRFLKNKSWNKYSKKIQRYLHLAKVSILLRKYKIDYIIPYQDELSYFFGAAHKYNGANKTLFHIRTAVLENKPKKDWFLEKALSNNLTIVANSNHARFKFEEVYGKKYDLNIKTIYNGLTLRTIDSTVNWKAFFGVESTEFVVSSIANFFRAKDFITIFKGWKCFVEETNSNAKLLIAGDEGITGRRSFYEKEVKALGLEDSIIFLGRISQNIELLSISDCNILSTKHEGLPNIVIETLAMAKPFLGTNVEGVREVVGDNYPLPLFQVGDYKMLSENLLKIFNNEVSLNNIKKYSLDRVKLFNIHRLIEDYSQIINLKK